VTISYGLIGKKTVATVIIVEITEIINALGVKAIFLVTMKEIRGFVTIVENMVRRLV